MWPSSSSPWVPAETSTVGPSPFAIVTTGIGMNSPSAPPLGRRSSPTCDTSADRSIVHVTGCPAPAPAKPAPPLIARLRRAYAGYGSSLREHGRDRGLGGLEQAVDVGIGVRVREVAALQVQRQLEDAVLAQLVPVAGE